MQPNLKGVSERVDGVSGLIMKQAMHSYNGIPQGHKRWLDQEDLVQEALIEAYTASPSQETMRILRRQAKAKGRGVVPVYQQGAGMKFSTYLMERLNWRFMKLRSTLLQHKRAGAVVELDAPVSVGEDDHGRVIDGCAVDVPITDEQWKLNDAVVAVTALCRALSQEAIVVLVRGLLCGDAKKGTPELYAEIRCAASKLKINDDDLRVITKDEESRKKALTSISLNVILDAGTETNLRILECVKCRGTFPLTAIREGRYFVSTMTCRSCHKELQRDPSQISCFGKTKRGKHDGWSEDDVACRLHCIDRKVCRQFIKEKETMGAVKDALADVDLGKAKDAKVKSKKKANGEKSKEAKAKTPKKKKEAAPAAEDPDGVPPKDVGPRWPYKAGSQMRVAWVAAYHGIKRADFEAWCKKGAKDDSGKTVPFNEKALLAVLKRDKSMLQRNPTHTWKLNEEGGRLKIYDVKYVGEKPAKTAAAKK